MRNLSNRYHSLSLTNGVFSFENKMNSPLKLTALNNQVQYEFVEKETICSRANGIETQIPFEDKVIVSVYLDEGNVAVLGAECYSAELDKSGIRKADILYVFLPQNGGSYSCYVFDMKHTYGHEKKDILRFYNQCISSAKYALSICQLVDDSDCIPIVEPHFGVITTDYSRDRLESLIQSLNNEPKKVQSAQEIKFAAQTRQNENEMSVLRSFLNAQVPFDKKIYPLDIRIAKQQPYELHFVNETLQ